MERIDLFPCSLYKTRLDGSLYDKKSIQDALKRNYDRSSIRLPDGNVYPKSNFHMYYENFDNPDFEFVSLDQLHIHYENIIKDFLNSLNNGSLQYKWSIVNVNVSKDGFMARHDHEPEEEFNDVYVMIHYLSFDNSQHQPTSFINSSYLKYKKSVKTLAGLLNLSQTKNSILCDTYSINTCEDDVIIFPGYLDHEVVPSCRENIDSLRMVIISNILVKYTGE